MSDMRTRRSRNNRPSDVSGERTNTMMRRPFAQRLMSPRKMRRRSPAEMSCIVFLAETRKATLVGGGSAALAAVASRRNAAAVASERSRITSERERQFDADEVGVARRLKQL